MRAIDLRLRPRLSFFFSGAVFARSHPFCNSSALTSRILALLRLSILNRRPNSIFVYGTLKRGECREHAWPRRPSKVIPARIRAELYDLGAYPAIVHGDDWVLGERWEFEPQDLLPTLKLLDEIEDFRNRPDDLYQRKVVACWDGVAVTAEVLGADEPTPCDAYAYFFSQAEHLRQAGQRLVPCGNVCQWLR